MKWDQSMQEPATPTVEALHARVAKEWADVDFVQRIADAKRASQGALAGMPSDGRFVIVLTADHYDKSMFAIAAIREKRLARRRELYRLRKWKK
jgi:hypothetical protein